MGEVWTILMDYVIYLITIYITVYIRSAIIAELLYHQSACKHIYSR